MKSVYTSFWKSVYVSAHTDFQKLVHTENKLVSTEN